MFRRHSKVQFKAQTKHFPLNQFLVCWKVPRISWFAANTALRDFPSIHRFVTLQLGSTHSSLNNRRVFSESIFCIIAQNTDTVKMLEGKEKTLRTTE